MLHFIPCGYAENESCDKESERCYMAAIRKTRIHPYLHRHKPQDTDTMASNTDTCLNIRQDKLISGKYTEMRNSVFAYILRRTGSMEDAEDLVQETFARLLEYRNVINEATINSFIFRIAGNLVVDWYRRHAHTEKAKEYFTSCRQREASQTEETVRLNEMLEIEMKCVRKMGKRKGEIYLLYIHKGKTSGEISEMLGLSKRTVENHILSARKTVREEFREAAG